MGSPKNVTDKIHIFFNLFFLGMGDRVGLILVLNLLKTSFDSRFNKLYFIQYPKAEKPKYLLGEHLTPL